MKLFKSIANFTAPFVLCFSIFIAAFGGGVPFIVDDVKKVKRDDLEISETLTIQMIDGHEENHWYNEIKAPKFYHQSSYNINIIFKASI